MTVFSLKNPGRGFCVERVRSQKTLVRVFTTLFALKKPLVGRVLIVLALKNPGRVDRVLSKKFIAVLWTLRSTYALDARQSTDGW